MKLALCLIVKGDDKEAALLDRCLNNLSPFVDGIFITITQENASVEAVATRYNAHISHFKWCHDFAAARNFNFSQVPKDYTHIMWTDADDMWRGLEKLKKTIKDNPFTDAFGFWYLYDWDEFKLPTVVHKKTMIIKNDGCAKWTGALHEDLEPTRQLDVRHVEGIERLHLTNGERAKENAERNVEIATLEQKKLPDDPRSYWNLGNAQYGVADYESALKTFNQFIDHSSSDAEKYIAHQRLADIYKNLGRYEDAIRSLQAAIGIDPMLCEAYFQLAYVFYQINNLDKAEYYCLLGLKKPPLIHKMIVFNPRDYDYNPMMLMAQIYFKKNRPDLMLPMLKGCLKIYPNDPKLKRLVKEGEAEYKSMGAALRKAEKLQSITDKKKLKAALDKLPTNIKSHPVIAAFRNSKFIKEKSSGRDLVIYCGLTTFEWNPELFKTKGFGGSEEAVINLARELAKLGWNVTVYNNCGTKPVEETVLEDKGVLKTRVGTGNYYVKRTVTYRPFWEWNYRDKQDVVILWRWVKPLDAEINAPKIFVDLHDVIPAGEFTEQRLSKVSKIFVKSQFHRSLFPNVPDDKFAVIPNGLDFSLLESDPPIKKDPYLMINTSSPDRSLDVLPKLFKEVKKRVPKAKLQWCYGWDLFKTVNATDTKKLEWMAQTQKEMDEAGIESLGKLTQEEVGKLYQKASILAYPTEFAEIDCISVRKAQAARCLPITTDFGALDESVEYGVKVKSAKTKDTWNRPYQFHFGLEDEDSQREWVAAVIELLEDQEAAFVFRTEVPNGWDDAPEWAQQFEWPKIAARWNEVLNESTLQSKAA